MKLHFRNVYDGGDCLSFLTVYGCTCLKGKSEVLSPDAIFWVWFYCFCFILLCFVLDRLSPSTLLSDDLVKTKFTLIAGVSRTFPV